MGSSRKIGRNKKSIIDLYFNDELKTFSQETKTPLIFILTSRTVLLLFLYLAAASIFYLIGNYQAFLDSDIKIILATLSVTATLLMIFSSAGFIMAFLLLLFDTSKTMRFRIRYFINMLGFLFSLISGFACLFGFQTIKTLSLGVS